MAVPLYWGKILFSTKNKPECNIYLLYVYCMPLHICEGEIHTCKHVYEGQSSGLSTVIASILFLRQGLSLKVGLTHLARLAGQ